MIYIHNFLQSPQMIQRSQAIGAPTDIETWRRKFDSFLSNQLDGDAAHDMSHLRRVASTALTLGASEGANALVVLTAAYFHDIVNLPKSHPERSRASAFSARRAVELLECEFPDFSPGLYDDVAHAIEAHSFSANICPRTIEAKVVQDADRLEALGAIGIARVFYIAGKLGQSLFEGNDPLAVSRPLNDKLYAVDHFRVKLFGLYTTMQTDSGRAMASKNTHYMTQFLSKLSAEVSGDMTDFDEQAIQFLTQGLQK